MNDRKIVSEIANWISGIVALMVMILIPLGYYTISYRYTVGSLEAEAEINSRIVSSFINNNPERWHFEEVRLEELLRRRPGNGAKESRRIVNVQNQIIAENSDPLDAPLITRTYPLNDSGSKVAQIEISRSLMPILTNTGLITCLGLFLGMSLYLGLKTLPFRAIIKAVCNAVLICIKAFVNLSITIIVQTVAEQKDQLGGVGRKRGVVMAVSPKSYV